jgi:hypothetical protein
MSNIASSFDDFTKLHVLTDEFCNFLKLPLGTMESRAGATRLLNAYIVENNLKSTILDRPTGIMPNKELVDLLKLGNDEASDFCHFKLQNHIMNLFVMKKSD